MTWLLALDTSTPSTALALGRVDRAANVAELVASATFEDRSPASGQLVARISTLFAEAGVTPRELGAVACGVGPGTFTGTRVALATAKGLAFALPCPLFAVDSLAALAGGAQRDGEVLALLDARRNEVYAGRYSLGAHGPVAHGEPRCWAIAQVIEHMADAPELQCVGPGAAAYSAALLGRDVQARAGVDAAGLWRAAARCFMVDAPADLDAVDAVYLRASYAELGTNTPRRAPFRSPFA